MSAPWADFPSFSEGLSLRHFKLRPRLEGTPSFPFLFGRAFIEAGLVIAHLPIRTGISLPFRKGFH